jgi:hypothetical protein
MFSRIHVLAALIACLLLCLSVLVVSCRNKASVGTSMPPELSTVSSPEAQSTNAAELFDRYPSRDFGSFEEAEAAAGYRIVRGPTEFPVSYDVTHLQWFPQFARPMSRTQYTYPPLAPTSIGLSMAPAYWWGDDQSMMNGRAIELGGRTAWVQSDHLALDYALMCGSIDGLTLWCRVLCPASVGQTVCNEFVSNLQVPQEAASR